MSISSNMLRHAEVVVARNVHIPDGIDVGSDSGVSELLAGF
jgi:hypothetical protein